jgi:hypothetical protein
MLAQVVKRKCKFRPRTGREGPEGEQRYSSILSLTSALDGGGWLTTRPGRFTPGKGFRFLLCRRLGGSQGRSVRVQKISPSPGFDPRILHPVASRYTTTLTRHILAQVGLHRNFLTLHRTRRLLWLRGMIILKWILKLHNLCTCNVRIVLLFRSSS